MHQVTDNKKHKNILEKANLGTLEQIARTEPRRYYDFRKETTCLSPAMDGQMVVLLGVLQKTKAGDNGRISYSKATVLERITHIPVSVTWYGTKYPAKVYGQKIGNLFLVCGELSYDAQWGYDINSPIVFTDKNITDEMKIIPVYKKKTGLAVDRFKEFVEQATTGFLDEFHSDILNRYGFKTFTQISRLLHFPTIPEEIEEGIKQVAMQDMLYFATHMKMRELAPRQKPIEISRRNTMDSVITELPYTLTQDQNTVVQELAERLMKQEPVNALVQGDVSCGKTITAILLLILAVENGYQSTLLAPTAVLATQHYEDITKIVAPLGLKAVFLGNGITAAEKRQALKDIKDGSADIIVGTHAVTSENVEFKNLGLVVIDEEQRFGVEKRESLKKKTINDIAYITMSATPIPRSLADTIYGEGTQIFSIHSMPSGRKPVTTVKTTNYMPPQILLEELAAGRQAYIICPLVDPNEKTEYLSCEETKQKYEKYLKACGMGHIKVGCLNGKMNEKDMLQTLHEFSNNQIQILVSTTVVEVGVNNPNASVIIIQDAERFGLSTLHQLRGRVRRGSYKPYCYLMSSKAESNERLAAMCQTEDGFELSMLDLQLRKSGNLLGLNQSGEDRFVSLIENYPDLYEVIKRIAVEMIEAGEGERYIDFMKPIYKNTSNKPQKTA